MSLIQTIVSRYGGWLASDKRSGAIPAPGHSARDRSVSLRLNQDNKLLIHCFSDTDWRDVQALLLRDGAVLSSDFVSGRRFREGGSTHSIRCRSRVSVRTETISHAHAAWAARKSVAGTLAHTYLKKRGIEHISGHAGLGFHSSWPMSPKPQAYRAPCLLAKITDTAGRLRGVQATFLIRSQNGLRKRRLVFGRQKECAIHLDAPTDQLLIGEGLESTVSAARQFKLPAWALLNTANLAAFRAPPNTRHLIIAHDNDKAGREAAHACAAINRDQGVICDLRAPTTPGADWNDADRLPGAP